MSVPSRPIPAFVGSVLLAALAFTPVLAGFDRAEITRAPDGDPNAISDWCEVRLNAGGRATLKLDGREATLSTAKGLDCRILSVVCSAALGDGASGFLVKLLDGPGRVELLWPPTRRNGWDATIRLYDAGPGGENYGVRLEWRRGSPEDDAPGQGGSRGQDVDRRDSAGWKRLSYDGTGRGSYRLAGAPRAAVESARWDANGDGRITGSFTIEESAGPVSEGGRSLEFEGHVASATRWQMVASIQAPGGISRRGSMTINRSRTGGMKRIKIEGVEDGRSFSISFSPA